MPTDRVAFDDEQAATFWTIIQLTRTTAFLVFLVTMRVTMRAARDEHTVVLEGRGRVLSLTPAFGKVYAVAGLAITLLGATMAASWTTLGPHDLFQGVAVGHVAAGWIYLAFHDWFVQHAYIALPAAAATPSKRE